MNPRRMLRKTISAALALFIYTSVYAAGDAPAQVPGAALPKGHYAALDKLPDWGGIWTITFPGPGTKRELPQLKGKYLADYQAFKGRHGAALADLRMLRLRDALLLMPGPYAVCGPRPRAVDARQ